MFDDDGYMNWFKMEKFLRSFNSNEELYIGLPGYGRVLEDKILDGMNFCQGGPGVIFSRATLKKLARILDFCLRVGGFFYV